ncbi:MAG: hypothetical protein IH953_00585 [Chloroflexi bacterium]|nr:hypothetical protein [Chloroflexota bacterium]
MNGNDHTSSPPTRKSEPPTHLIEQASQAARRALVAPTEELAAHHIRVGLTALERAMAELAKRNNSARLAAIVGQAARRALFSSSRKETNKAVRVMLAAHAARVRIRADFLFPESRMEEE